MDDTAIYALLRRHLIKSDARILAGILVLLVGILVLEDHVMYAQTHDPTIAKHHQIPWSLDGMAYLKVAYPANYEGIEWLNAHVHGSAVIAEAYSWDSSSNAYSRVSMFTGLPSIMNGIHEGEQRYQDELDPGVLCASTQSRATCREHTPSRVNDVKKYEGITLAAPPAGVSVISAGTAEHAALEREYGNGATVLEDVLAVEHNAWAPSMDGCLCWVVSQMPADGDAYSSGDVMKLQYDLIFIDARTGAFAGEIQRGPVTEQQRGNRTP